MNAGIPISALDAVAPHRKAGWRQAVLAVAEHRDGKLFLTDKDFTTIQKTYSLDSAFVPLEPSLSKPIVVQGFPITGPGDILAGVIKTLGFQPTSGCGCEAMRAKMNDWGYFGCWQNRREILEFLKTKADAVGVQFDDATVWAAVVAAFSAAKRNLIQHKKVLHPHDSMI